MTHVMTCTECLRLVATADLSERTATTAVTEHCWTCADCASVVDELSREARRLADTLDGTLPGVPAHVVALQAIAGAARGRRRAGHLRTALSVIGVIAIVAMSLLVSMRLVLPANAASVEVRTVELHCLAPEQALALARPQLPPQVTVIVRPAVRLPILTLRGTRPDLATAAQLITQLDARWGAEWSGYCDVASRVDGPSTNRPSTNVP